MKILNLVNIFLVGIPIILTALGLITQQSNGNLIGYALLFVMLTSLFQVIIGILLLLNHPTDKMLRFYNCGVLLFVFCWICNVNIKYFQILEYLQYALPPILAIYFSAIIYKKANR
ncbi:hypothetical protein [Flavobacterium sp. HBTb2-11-1]|uniref:hypothetical protein n=1 Tax=Flavobacterium sp. HBTb2-11-1 TaxID=2692212 RepID=UPI00136933EC|nr:hypothetical protein [Flavobacterium sp. HBTb2-11-1]MXO05915.1 hypothetical protein [Flavobacterium sp. HBTb2-11-1]